MYDSFMQYTPPFLRTALFLSDALSEMGRKIGLDEWSKNEDLLKSKEAESRTLPNPLKYSAQEPI